MAVTTLIPWNFLIAGKGPAQRIRCRIDRTLFTGPCGAYMQENAVLHSVSRAHPLELQAIETYQTIPSPLSEVQI